MKMKVSILVLVSLLVTWPIFSQDNASTELLSDEKFDALVDDYWSFVKDSDMLTEQFTLFIEADVNTVAAYAYRASLYRVGQNWSAAEADLNAALALNPNDALNLSVVARLLFDQGDVFNAQEFAERAIESDETIAEVHYNRARVLTEPQAIIDSTTKAISLNPRAEFYNHRGVAYKNIGHFTEALDDYLKAIELDEFHGLAYQNAGVLYRETYRFEEALGIYTQGIEQGIQYAILYGNRGALHYELSNYEAAEADLLRAIEIDPTEPLFPYNLGIVYGDMGNIEASIERYSQAILVDPTYHQAYLNRGGVYVNAYMPELAIEDFTTAIELVPNFGLAYYHRGMILWNTSRDEEALPDLEIAFQFFPYNEDLLFVLAVVYERLEQYENAVEILTRMIELDDTKASIYSWRGRVYKDLGNDEAAAADFEIAEQLDN